MIVEVEREERYWYPDDGGIVWLAGFQPVAPDGRYLGREAPELAAAGLRIAGDLQVGWVPRAIAEEIAPKIDAGEPFSAIVLREQRASPRDPRTGLTMLIAAAPAIELRV